MQYFGQLITTDPQSAATTIITMTLSVEKTVDTYRVLCGSCRHFHHNICTEDVG